ncbi:hypothetical protein BT96DRAFT_1015486 [Gymnopus androsaceus JB14]|uniref:Uncharacterized protein n=1 Tax=Gymnopus androsaceus JB14 TaxID=1447944 RepID=A0A6A4I8U3_9AGAR|nr:hypothetical protein BT96DRAFT_1015486 [Gymnopus androsaceus JB14]
MIAGRSLWNLAAQDSQEVLQKLTPSNQGPTYDLRDVCDVAVNNLGFHICHNSHNQSRNCIYFSDSLVQLFVDVYDTNIHSTHQSSFLAVLAAVKITLVHELAHFFVMFKEETGALLRSNAQESELFLYYKTDPLDSPESTPDALDAFADKPLAVSEPSAENRALELDLQVVWAEQPEVVVRFLEEPLPVFSRPPPVPPISQMRTVKHRESSALRRLCGPSPSCSIPASSPPLSTTAPLRIPKSSKRPTPRGKPVLIPRGALKIRNDCVKKV